MRLLAALLLATCIVGGRPMPVHAQPTTRDSTAQPDSGRMVGAIRAFIDCRGDTSLGCDPNFFVLELPYITWTRDRQFADVQLLVTTIRTGSGAFEYTVNALGRERFTGRSDTLIVRPLPNEAEDGVRRRLAKAFALLLVPYVRTTPQAAFLTVAFADPSAGKQLSPGSVRDKWNFWVGELRANGFVDGESRRTNANFFVEARARRITEQWSSRFGVRQETQFSRFEIDSTNTFRNTVREGIAFGRVVKALSPRWSAGLLGNVGYNEFRNTALVARLAPVVEFNLFPWKEATRRQLAISYGVGPRFFRWEDTTIFGRLRETRVQQELVIGADVRQSWGSINISSRYASFIPDTRKWNLSAFGDVNLNIVKGLQFNIGGGGGLVRDQLFLSARGQSPEEVLTRQRALATNYNFFVFTGFSYSFGSIYNSVVNPRLDFFNLGGNN